MKGKKPPTPPAILKGEALDEWHRTIEQMDEAGTLETADRGLIAMRALAWARWVKAEEAIAAKSEIVKAPKTEVPQYNLWLSVSNKAHEQVTKLSFELGLSPNSRAKIGKSKPIAEDDAGDALSY